MISSEIREKAEKWLKTSITTREPKSKAALCRKLGISVPTLNTIEREPKSGNGFAKLDDLPTDEKVKIFDRLLFQLIQDPKTPSKDRELFAKRYGLSNR